MSDILSVPTLGLANNHNNNRNNTEQRRRQENSAPLHTTLSSSSSSSPAPRVTFPTNVTPSPPSTIRRNATTTTARSTSLASTTAQPFSSSPAPSYPDSHSPRHSSISSSTLTTTTTTLTTPGATTGTGAAAAGALVRMEDASPIILFTLQYSVAVVQGVTIFILSAVFSILQLVSGHLNDTPQSPPSSGSGTTTGGTMVGRRRNVAGGGSDDERRRQRRRRWSGSGTGNGSSTSATTWAQNLIAHTTTIKEDSIRPQSSHASGQQEHAGTEGGGGTGGTLAQRVEVLRFLGSTIATLVGGYTTSFGTSSKFSSASGGEEGMDSTKLAGEGAGGVKVPEVPTGGEMNYSSRIRRALAKTLSGHALPIPRSIKRVTFNDTVQFHTTTGRSRTRFNSNEEDEEEEEEDEASSSPVSRFFSSGFSASAAGLSHEEPMSSSPLPATPVSAADSGVKGQRKTRPPSIMPPVRDRKQLQEQDDLEAQGNLGVRATGISVASNGRIIPVSTTTMASGTGTSTVAKKLVSTITIALPPLSRPRKQQQQQQQQQQPISPVMTIVATSTTTAAGAATTSTTTTNKISTPTPTSYSPATGSGSGGRAGLASALLSSLMMPAAPAPISDAARSLLISTSSPTTSPTSTAGENSAAILLDSDSSKSSGRGLGGSLRRTGSGSAPSKISTFLQQHRLTRQPQQQQQQQPSQMQGQGLFGPGEYTSPISAVSSTGLTVDVRKANSGRTIPTAPSTAPLPSTSGTYTTPTSPTTSSLVRQRSLYSIHSTVSSTVSSAVAAVIGTEPPPPSVPTSLTTSMALFLSSANSTDGFSPLLSPRLGPMGGKKYQHQRKRSASVDLSGMVSTTMAAMMVSGMNGSEVPPSPGGVPTTSESAPMGSGGRSLMYKLTHPQRYKRELGLQQQLQQHQQQYKDTNSLSSATSSPSASQVALPSTFSTTSVASITSTSSTGSGILQHERPPFRPSPGSGSGSSSASGMVSPTRVVYPFSRSFSDLPASLSYLSDEPPPTPSLPSSYFTAAMTAESLPSPTLSPSLSPAATTTNVAATGEIYQPHPLPSTPITATKPVSSSSSSGAENKKEATPLKESTTPPLSLFFPSPTTQHRPLPSPLLSPSLPTSATMVFSNVKDSLSQQLRRSPSPRISGGGGRRSKSSSSSSPMMEDKSSHDVHTTTTFAACGFSVSASSSSSSSSSSS